ncbi:MAG: hypothetical protein WBE46_01050 [Dehalococcoidia bacterium]
MSKKKLAAIIVGVVCVIGIIVKIAISIPGSPPTSTPTPHFTGSPGYSRSNPVGLNSPLSIWVGTCGIANYQTNDYEVRITLLETMRGDAAWQLIHEAWTANDPPEAGFEYILAKVRFEYLTGPTPDTTYEVASPYFDAVSSDGKEYNSALILDPEPRIYARLYPNASHEGWATFQVAKNDAKPLLTFGRKRDGTGGIWFELY